MLVSVRESILPTSGAMHGRVCLVTGASSGLGLATATALAQRGATVVMLCRDAERGAAAVEHVRWTADGADVSLLLADLASFAAIRTAAVAVTAAHPALHVLVHNAGITTRRRRVSADGIELTLAVNHLAPFLLTALLLPALRAGAPARVVTVSSRVERMGRIDFDDLPLTRRYSGVRAYARSKLANILFTYALAERLTQGGIGVTANCLHPGFVDTALMRESPRWMRALWRPLLSTPARGARTAVYLATAPELEGVTGRYFEDGDRVRRSSRRSYDVALRERLWDVSAALTGAPSIP